MKLHIEPTSRIVEVMSEDAPTGVGAPIPARVWQGVTDNGIEVTLLVTRVACDKAQDLSELTEALTEVAVPRVPAIDAFPHRLIL